MGTLAVTEELHAKQKEAARKEAERAARKAPQDAAADAKGEAGEPASKKKGSAARSSRPPGRPAIGGRACRAQAGRPGDGTRWDTGTLCRQPSAQDGAAADRRSRRIRRVAPGRRGDGARRDGGTRAGRALQMMPHQESASETAPRSIYDPGAASGVAQNALYSSGNAWSCGPFGAAGPAATGTRRLAGPRREAQDELGAGRTQGGGRGPRAHQRLDMCCAARGPSSPRPYYDDPRFFRPNFSLGTRITA